jgi:hypothetical protein
VHDGKGESAVSKGGGGGGKGREETLVLLYFMRRLTLPHPKESLRQRGGAIEASGQ